MRLAKTVSSLIFLTASIRIYLLELFVTTSARKDSLLIILTASRQTSILELFLAISAKTNSSLIFNNSSNPTFEYLFFKSRVKSLFNEPIISSFKLLLIEIYYYAFFEFFFKFSLNLSSLLIYFTFLSCLLNAIYLLET